MKPKVYISVGSAPTPTQAQAIDAIFRSLETAGLSPRQMDRNEWSAEQPLRAIKRVIDQCAGIVVIAFARYQFLDGTERQKDGSEKQLTGIRITTVWNQIEAALGYAKGLPLLVIAESGLLEDGLLEGRYDWKVFWTDFTSEQLGSDGFIGFIESWKNLVLEREGIESQVGIKDNDLSKLSIRQLLGSLTISQLWAGISALFGLLIGVASAAFRAGAGKWPWQ